MKMICPHCKSPFNVERGLLKEYVYRIGDVYYCSYKCWRANKGGIVYAKATEDGIQESR